MKKTKISTTIKIILGVASAGMMSGIVNAQDTAEGIDEVVVTGSRIQRADLEGFNPVTVLDRATITDSGALNIGAILQDLPNSAGQGVNTGVNNGGNGSVNFSLRGLGSNRTLVLINGRRAVASGLGADDAVDLNNIPVSIVERVEILKDGASAVYGSDALAGVVNIITRSDFEGVEVTSTIGETSEGDGRQTLHEVIAGTNTDKGNFVVSAYWAEQEEIWAGDRDYSREEIWYHPYWDPTGQDVGGSSAPPWGNYGGSDDIRYTQGPDGGDWREYDGTSDSYNYAPANYTQTPSERWGFSAFGSYNIGDIGLFKNIELSTEFMYTHRRSDVLLAPEPLAPLAFFGTAAPYSDKNWYNQQYGPKDADGNTMVLADWRRRMVETGGRNAIHETNTHQISLSLSGQVKDWNWDMSAVYGENDASQTNTGNFSLERVAEAVGPTYRDDAGNLFCSPDGTADGVIDGCVPLNVFGTPGTDSEVTQDMLQYISGNYTSITEGGNDMSQVQANVSGDLFSLPAGPVGMAFGIEHRDLGGFELPDALQILGTTTAGASLATKGGYKLDEVYVEFAIPLLDGLDLSLASRYSDYETFGSTTNSKIGLRWAVTDELTLRGTVSEAFRAPSIPDLYTGIVTDFPSVTDPCATNATASCVANGVPAGGYNNEGIIQLPTRVGGNVDLQPETADTLTVGLVYTPAWIEGTSLTIDYWKTEIENQISSIGPQVILDNCAATGAYCEYIERWAAGSGAEVGSVRYIYDLQANVGSLEASGVDLSIRHQLAELPFGNFDFRIDAAFVEQYDLTISTGEVIKHAGRFENDLDGNFPRTKMTYTLNWDYGNWSASYKARYIAGVTETLDSWYNATPEEHSVSSQVVQDVQLSYDLVDFNTKLTLGIDNVADKQPPYAYSGFNDNTDPRTYETRGRFMYGRVSFVF
mgnify:FL=1|tara:strand:+ start:3016 stop:5799 length:2784 start_codon:yes stop_codon:yes gene_type:complete